MANERVVMGRYSKFITPRNKEAAPVELPNEAVKEPGNLSAEELRDMEIRVMAHELPIARVTRKLVKSLDENMQLLIKSLEEQHGTCFNFIDMKDKQVWVFDDGYRLEINVDQK